MKIVFIMMPLTFAVTFISGMLGLMDAAYILLATGVGLFIGYLMISTITNYLLVEEEEPYEIYPSNKRIDKLAI